MMNRPNPSLLLSLLLLSMLSLFALSCAVMLAGTADATFDEAYGIVTRVVDGDTIDVTLEKYAPNATNAIERVRLADVDSPEMKSEAGQDARDFTYAVLMNRRVYLDIDDLSSGGRDKYGRLVCLVYMAGYYGQPIPSPNYNLLLVESGHAKLEDFKNNEFDPADWTGKEVSPSENWVEDEPQAQSFQDNITAQVRDSAERTLDQAADSFWKWLKGQAGI